MYGLDEEALLQRGIARHGGAGAAPSRRRSPSPSSMKPLHLLELALGDDGADVGLLVQRIAHDHRVDRGLHGVDEALSKIGRST